MCAEVKWLELASFYAKQNSGCTKVQVGCAIVKDWNVISMGANRAIPDSCRISGCLRIEKYGDNAKEHRLPSDCRAIHSEIDAIASAPCSLAGATIYITRYPCEACARAIVAAGITRVVYGREQEISDETWGIFTCSGVKVIHISEFKEDDVTT